MVVLESHKSLLNDRESQARQIGEDFFDMRSPRLARLSGVEALARAAAPLPISYDINRCQPPYFFEFTYTEGLGCLMVSPQSREATARLAADFRRTSRFSVSDAIEADLVGGEAIDKYCLDEMVDPDVRKIAYLPGSNIFNMLVSRENFTRLLHDDPEIFIKPHPLTDGDLIRYLGREFGYHRLLDPNASGVAYLRQAEKVYVTTTTELGLYATLLGVPVVNISNYITESFGIYYQFYRLIAGKTPGEARSILKAALDSDTSGMLHPEDPEAEARIARYFDAAMRLRESLKPLVPEISPIEWSDHLNRHLVKNKE